MNDRNYIALIPAYKPLPLLPDLVAELTENGLRVVLVNDGSGADFDRIFEKCAATAELCTHKANKGKGRALKTGLEYILKEYGSSPIVVTVDADGQHAVRDALDVCKLAEKNPGKLIFGSRKFTGKVPFKSRVGNTMTQVSYHIFSGISMFDTQTGLRAFSADLIPALLEIKGERYEYEINMLFDFTKRNIPIVEHEIETIYINDNSSSHFHPVRDTYRLHAQIFKAVSFSYISIAADLALFIALWLATSDIFIANIVARALSATLRLILNRRFGFKPRAHKLRSAVIYIAAAIGILAVNTAALYLLATLGGIPAIAAKLIVTALGFPTAWLIKKIVNKIKKDHKNKIEHN